MTASDDKLQDQWQDCLLSLSSQGSLSKLSSAHIKLLRPKALFDTTLILAAPNQAVRKKVEEKKTYSLIEEAVRDVFGSVTPHVIVEAPEEVKEENTLFELESDVVVKKSQDKTTSKAVDLPQLNPKYTFENFVKGPNNRFAFSAALAVAEKPGGAYNPFFIYGRSGLGKTHLLHAIGHYALEESGQQNIKVLYVNAEEFTNAFINTISSDKAKTDFKNRYRNADYLLIDDIQFLGGKNTTREEFFHTFNALLDGNKQVVITSDVPPAQLHTFEERLRSRFNQGMIIDVVPPNLETRIMILRQKAKMENVHVPAEVIELIASKVSSNIRELEGALIRVCAYSDLTNTELNTDLTETVLKELLHGYDEENVSLEAIVQETASFYDLHEEDIRGTSRARNIALPRQITMYLCRELIPNITLGAIGKELGNRDHTTVMHAVKQVSKLLQTDKKIYDNISEITANVKSN